MGNGTLLGRGTITLYAAANALVSAVIAVVAIWGGAPLAAIPWIISAIICANVAVRTSIGWEPGAPSASVTAGNIRRARRCSQAQGN